MATSDEVLATARGLMREGKVQEADDLITQHQAATAAAAAATQEVTPPAPREPNAIIADALNVLVGLAGNPEPLVKLLEELFTVL